MPRSQRNGAVREKEAQEAQIRSEEAVEIIRISRDQAVEVEQSLRGT